MKRTPSAMKASVGPRRRANAALLLLAAAILTGCAAPRRIPVTQYEKDQWTCEHQAYANRAPGLVAVALYHDCMRAHGWSK